MCGLRPDSTGVWNLYDYFRNQIEDRSGYNVTTLPQAFKDKGWRVGGSGKSESHVVRRQQTYRNPQYDATAIGKPAAIPVVAIAVFHPGHASGKGVTGPGDDYPISWTEPYFHAPAR